MKYTCSGIGSNRQHLFPVTVLFTNQAPDSVDNPHHLILDDIPRQCRIFLTALSFYHLLQMVYGHIIISALPVGKPYKADGNHQHGKKHQIKEQIAFHQNLVRGIYRAEKSRTAGCLSGIYPSLLLAHCKEVILAIKNARSVAFAQNSLQFVFQIIQIKQDTDCTDIASILIGIGITIQQTFLLKGITLAAKPEYFIQAAYF